MIDIDKLSGRVAGLSAMRFFPSKDDKEGRLEITKAIASMAGTYDRALWIIEQILNLSSDWPGIPEVRGVFCHRFPPADGVSGESALCPDGHIPDQLKVGKDFPGTKTALESGRHPRDGSLPEVPELKRLAERKRI